MKRIISLALSLSICAACLMPAKAEAAVAVNASGMYTIRTQYYDNVSFTENTTAEPLNLGSNMILALVVAASPDLMAVITMRNLDPIWGINDGSGIRSQGWLDDISGILMGHIQYNTKNVLFRGGQLQNDKGSYTFVNSLINGLPMAGLQAVIRANDNMDIDFTFSRPVASKGSDYSLVKDSTIDLFDLSVPMNFDTFKIRPYATYINIGTEVDLINATDYTSIFNILSTSATPAYLYDVASGVYGADYLTNYANVNGTKAYMGGFSATVNPADYLNLTLDFHYGKSTTDFTLAGSETLMDRAGFVIGASADYELTFATIGIVGWYSSGDDDDASNGSERAVIFGAGAPNLTTRVAGDFAGDMLFDTDGLVVAPNYPGFVQVPGTMGVTLGINGISFKDRLTHSLWANYTAGTNHVDSTPAGYVDYRRLTTEESVMQFGMVNWYPFTRNLIGAVEFAYGMSNLANATSADNPIMVDFRVNYLF